MEETRAALPKLTRKPSNCPSSTARSFRSRPSGRAPSRRTSRRCSRSSRSGPAPRSTSSPTGDNVATFLGSKIEGGAPPDVAMLPQVGVLKQFAEKGWLKPLGTRPPGRSSSKNFSTGWQELGAVEGKQYGVYFKAANKSLIWYNSAGLRERGRRASRRPGTTSSRPPRPSPTPASTPVSVGGARRLDPHRLVREHLPLAGGPGEVRPARQAQDQVDRPVGQEGADHARPSCSGKKELLAGGNDGALQTDFPTSVTQAFDGGDSPRPRMVFEGDFVGVNIAKDTKAKIGKDAKVFPFPAVGGEAPVVSGGDAAVALKDGKAAQALLTFLASPDAADDLGRRRAASSPPTRSWTSAYPNDVAAGDRQGADRRGRRLPLRHVRPGPGRLRRHQGQGRVEGPAGLPEEPEGRRGHAAAAGGATPPRRTRRADGRSDMSTRPRGDARAGPATTVAPAAPRSTERKSVTGTRRPSGGGASSCCPRCCCSARSSSTRSCTRSSAASSTRPATSFVGLGQLHRDLHRRRPSCTALKNNVDLGGRRPDRLAPRSA